jgi:hypothetical protein
MNSCLTGIDFGWRYGLLPRKGNGGNRDGLNASIGGRRLCMGSAFLAFCYAT